MPNINVNNNINCWYVVLILLHWWNNKKFKKWFGQKNPLLALTLQVKKILNIHHRKKNLNKSYWEFDFSMGTVLVIFSFLWTDNAPCLPPDPPSPPIGKNCNIHHRKKKLNGNYVELDFSMGTVLVIFSFFWTDNAPLSPPICKTINIHRRKKKLNENYVEFYFSMGIVLVIFLFFWMVNDLVCVPPPLCGMSPVFSTPQLFTYFRA